MGTTAEELQYSEPPTRICGQDEAYAVDVVAAADGKNRISVDDQTLASGENGQIAVGTSPVEIKAGVSRLAGRKTLSFMPLNGIIYYGPSASVTTSTGRKVFTNQVVDIPWGDFPLYAVAASSVNLHVMEAK